ncbi:MAG: hypothetical protein ACYCSW_11270 [bacterium]|jgi:hypothetical protein
MNDEQAELKKKMHDITDNVFDTAESIVNLFNNISSLFPDEEKKVVNLKLVKKEKDKD